MRGGKKAAQEIGAWNNMEIPFTAPIVLFFDAVGVLIPSLSVSATRDLIFANSST
jgi:hypothetical protein